MAIADALKVNSSLISLNLQKNSIQNEGAIAIAHGLKVNFSLTSLNLSSNSVQQEGAIAIAKALQMNITLTLLDLGENQIHQVGATSIAKALTYNPTLLDLGCNQQFSGLQEFKATYHNLHGLLNILFGEDVAQVLGIAFRLKGWYFFLTANAH